jgi:hypothetical protein
MASPGGLFVNLISTFDDKGLQKADQSLGKTEGSLGKFGKAAGLAFAAAGAAALAYAGTLLVDGVKAAIEDEKAQVKLATALKNATGATDDQIAATEDYITQASIQFGITDDKLRPSFEKLAIATGSLTKAQELQTLAMDVAAGTGKDLDAVSLALSKAYNGNVGALTRLGVPLDENIIKTKDFEGATLALADAFGGQAAAQADTFEGKMTRLNIAFDEAKETAGAFILDAIQPLADIAVNNVIPALSQFGEEVGQTLGPILTDMGKTFTEDILPVLEDFGSFIMDEIVPNLKNAFMPVLEALQGAFETIKKAVEDNKPALDDLYEGFKIVIAWITANLLPLFTGALSTAISGIATTISTVVTVVAKLVEGFKTFVNFTKNAVGTIKTTFTSIGDAITKPFKVAFREVAKFWNNTLGKFKITIPDWIPLIGGKEFAFPKLPVPELANGGIVKARRGGTLALIGEGGRDEAVIPLPKGMRKDGIGGGITINVSGALDPEAVARQIETILKRSKLRAGAY